MQIEVNNLSKTYKTWKRGNTLSETLKSIFKREFKEIRALRNVSFSIEEGEKVGIIGPNGAGKSTLIKIMTGVLWPTKGYVRIMGKEPYKSKEVKEKIGVVFGQKSQFDYMVTPKDNIQFIASIYNVKNWKKRFEKLVKTLNAKELENKPVRTLSFGERMKFEIVASLIHDPKILFLDEPTIGMDVEIKEELREFLRSLDKTIIITSHDMGDIEEVVDRVILIYRGKILFDGKLRDLIKKYVKTKIVEVEAKEEIPLKYERRVGNYYRFNVRRNKVKKFVENLMKYQIIDLTIREPKLERIIANIYRRGKV